LAQWRDQIQKKQERQEQGPSWRRQEQGPSWRLQGQEPSWKQGQERLFQVAIHRGREREKCPVKIIQKGVFVSLSFVMLFRDIFFSAMNLAGVPRTSLMIQKPPFQHESLMRLLDTYTDDVDVRGEGRDDGDGGSNGDSSELHLELYVNGNKQTM
jgi:hypothetical protein